MGNLPNTYSDQSDVNVLIMTPRGLENPALIWARDRCAAHIEQYYPAYKQLNILRVGSDAEKSRMGHFIDACRAWSNGANPDPAALDQITPGDG